MINTCGAPFSQPAVDLLGIREDVPESVFLGVDAVQPRYEALYVPDQAFLPSALPSEQKSIAADDLKPWAAMEEIKGDPAGTLHPKFKIHSLLDQMALPVTFNDEISAAKPHQLLNLADFDDANFTAPGTPTTQDFDVEMTPGMSATASP